MNRAGVEDTNTVTRMMDSVIGVTAHWTHVSCNEVTRPISSGYSDGG